MQAKSSDVKEAFSKKRNDSLQNLKSSLIKKWIEKKVDLCYQNTVLSYISEMLPEQAEQEILIEREKVIENKAEYLKISRLRQERQLIMDDLEDYLKDQDNIRLACDGVDKLRKINLKICEAILAFRDKLKQRNIKNDAILKGYGQLLLTINQDNKLIMNSYMSNFVQFAIGYDPFFLYPYEKLESGRVSDDFPQPVIKLFKMNISYVYRLIKAKKQINELLSEKNRDMTISQTESNRESNRQSQTQKQQVNNVEKLSRYNMKIKKKRKIILPSHKYQTINHEPQDPDCLKNSSLRAQSQPKKSMKSSFIGQQIEKKQRSGPKKFRIRDKSQSEKSNSLRFRSQNYDHAEDQDINEFRRKMFQRRARRNRLEINTRKNQEQEELIQKRTQLKKNSLNLKKYSEIMAESGSANLRKNWNMGDQQVSSEQQQLLQSRNLEQSMKNSHNRQKFNKIRYNMRKKTQFIKLQPLDKPKINDPAEQNPDEDEDNLELASHLNLSKSFLEEKKIKKNYLPLSPTIKEMNKQSSSGKSEQENSQSEQAYTGDKKQELFQDINKNDEQNENNFNFRVKKLQSIDLSSSKQKNPIKEYAEEQALNPVDEKKFRDQHLRNPKVQENHLKKVRQNQSRRSIENKNEYNQTNEQKNEAKPKQKILKLEINKMLEQKEERQKENPTKQQELPTYRYRNQTQSNYPSNLAPYRVITNNKILDEIEEMEQNKNKNKQIKLKPGQINVDDLFSFIQKQKISELQRKQFEVGLWKENIILKHSYLTKFYMNSQLAAFGISSPRCDGDYSILYWGTTCPQNFTFFLFKKYLDYLQKFTSLNSIYIGNPDYKEAEFEKKGTMYQRKRKNFQKRSLPYFPFLSLQCSNICFSQEIDKKNSIFFYSQQISQFTNLNSMPNNFVGFCDPKSAAALPTNAQFHQKISSIAEVNSILQKLEIDTFATSEKIQIKECKVFTLKDHCAIKSNYFYIRNGYFAPKGTQVYSKEKEKIMKLDMDKQQYSLFFGKKFKNIESFLSNCNFNPGPNNFFAFKMFSKQLYGRIKNKQFTSEGCYGNWDINFLWQDQLKGTVIKEMPAPQYIFGPQSFYVALFKAETFIFAFEVQPSDFFF